MSEARQEEQVWTDPGPAVMYAVATITFVMWAFATGQVGLEASLLAIPPMLAAGIVASVGGIIDMRRGMIFTATLNLLLGAILGFGGATQMGLMSWAQTQGLPIDPRINGYMWMAAGVILLIMAIISLRMSWFFFLGVLVLAVSVFLIGVPMVGMAATWGVIGGWLIGIFSLWALYIGTAILVNTLARKPVLPI